MNSLIKISILFIYVFLTQIYSVVHWHAQEHHGDIELQVSVHPTEFSLDYFDHDNHHDYPDDHEHEDTHFEGDWDYTFQSKTIQSAIEIKSFKGIETLDIEPKVLSRIPRYIPLKIAHQYIPFVNPKRGPPLIS